jgi:hypothetical protein
MRQEFAHYEAWEDYQNGMYLMTDIDNKDLRLINAIQLLREADLFYMTCGELIKAWPVSSKVNLTNLAQNRRAWLGAAACCYKYSAPEFLTRIAWSVLNKEHQDSANSAADRVIKEFENLNKSNYAKTLFEC